MKLKNVFHAVLFLSNLTVLLNSNAQTGIDGKNTCKHYRYNKSDKFVELCFSKNKIISAKLIRWSNGIDIPVPSITDEGNGIIRFNTEIPQYIRRIPNSNSFQFSAVFRHLDQRIDLMTEVEYRNALDVILNGGCPSSISKLPITLATHFYSWGQESSVSYSSPIYWHGNSFSYPIGGGMTEDSRDVYEVSDTNDSDLAKEVVKLSIAQGTQTVKGVDSLKAITDMIRITSIDSFLLQKVSQISKQISGNCADDLYLQVDHYFNAFTLQLKAAHYNGFSFTLKSKSHPSFSQTIKRLERTVGSWHVDQILEHASDETNFAFKIFYDVTYFGFLWMDKYKRNHVRDLRPDALRSAMLEKLSLISDLNKKVNESKDIF